MSTVREKVYVTHTCKNSHLKSNNPNYCFNAFVDIDKHKSTAIPPSWKYCPECEAKGFKNKSRREMSEKQIIQMMSNLDKINSKGRTEKIAQK